MKEVFKYIFVLLAIGIISSCNDDPKSPGYEYMPDMYRSGRYNANSANPLFPDSMTDRQPVKGTVARGNDVYTSFDRLPYPYANDSLGYELAGKELHNPLEKTAGNMAEGKRLYENYCQPCHDAKGTGNGLVPQNNGPKPPSYTSDQLKNLPEGKMFHSTEYGKNNMGSYASQLVASQRWKVIMYVQTLQHPETAADSAKKKTAALK